MKKFFEVNEKISRYRWVICGLLFAATTFNYLDRAVLSILMPKLQAMFGWTNTDYANIIMVFQLIYGFGMLFAGRFIDWIGAKWGYAIALTLWTVASVSHAWGEEIGGFIMPAFSLIGLAIPASVLGFMFARFWLGIGEAANFPAAIKVTAEWFPRKERSLATGIFNSGANIGAVVTPLTVPLIVENWGWQWAFYIIGGISIIWVPFWFWLYEKPKKMLDKGKINQAEFDYIHSDNEVESSELKEKEEKVSWLKLFTYKQTWSFTFGKFMTDGVWWFFLFWLPAYLKAQYNMEDLQIMLPLGIVYTMTMIGSIAGGWFPAYFIKRGMEPYKGRMAAMLTIAVMPLIVLAAQPMGELSWIYPVIFIGIGASAHQAWSANIFTTVSDLFPKKAVASVVGIGGMAGAFGGILVNKVAGWLFDYYESLGHITTGYTIMFIFCAVAYVVSWGVMKLLVPKFNPIKDL
ncbi:MAG: MFS transporter [Paludibacter sp.]|nr:MFS transporter [Paludibacter sp.]